MFINFEEIKCVCRSSKTDVPFYPEYMCRFIQDGCAVLFRICVPFYPERMYRFIQNRCTKRNITFFHLILTIRKFHSLNSHNYHSFFSVVSFIVVTSERSDRSTYQQSYICHLDDIRTALKPLKKSEKNGNTYLLPFQD